MKNKKAIQMERRMARKYKSARRNAAMCKTHEINYWVDELGKLRDRFANSRGLVQ